MLSNAIIRKRILPIAIIVLGLIIAKLIIANPPEAQRTRPNRTPQMTVEVLPLIPQNYQIKIASFGTVQPRIQSLLIAQAAGEVNYLSENFRAGGFFTKGEVLLKLDDRDNIADVKIAQANLFDAKQKLAEEQARSIQAKKDWQRIGQGKEANGLVLREPQLAAAKARLLSAQAQLTKAELALERTQIIAPYDGRILSQKVDLGQVIVRNNQLAEIYATDAVEIRLPIKNQDLALLELPEQNKHNTQASVTFYSTMNQQTWQGKLIRTESAISEKSQQLYVVAQIEKPYANTQLNQQSIKIGQYVSAEIDGKTLTDALVIPTQAIYQGSYVYIVENDVLLRKNIELLWKNKHEAVIKSGLKANDQVVITALGRVSSGTPVQIADDNKTNTKQSNNNSNKEKKAQGNIQERLAKMPAKMREKLTQEAAERGISIEQLMKEKRQQRQQAGAKE